jgi:GntR family transcriptional regulator, transcriptional repressor for pyruvate dehydrogenase complex
MSDASDSLTPPPALGGGPIARRKTYELVADRLVELIGARSLRSGDQLPTERELTESFGVGRSSIREALRMLESQGVIRPGTGGAFTVASAGNTLNSSLRLLLSLDEVQVHEVFELRIILECEAAALAAARRDAVHLELMDAATTAMEESLTSGSELDFIEGDLQFHLAIAEASANRLVLHSMQAVRDVIRRALVSIFHIPHSPERAIGEHRDIRAAIADADAERARSAMRAHLVRVETDVDKGAMNG